MAKVFHWEAGSLLDKVSGNLLTNNDVEFKQTEKGWAGCSDSTNMLLNAGRIEDVELTDYFSISIIFKATPYSVNARRLYNINGINGFSINIPTTGEISLIIGLHLSQSNSTITDNKWHIVTFTADLVNNIVKTYIDGVLDDTDSSGTGTPIYSTQDLYLFSDNGTYEGYNCYIHSIKHFNTILTDQERNKEYVDFLNRQAIGPAKSNFAHELSKPKDLSNKSGLVAAYNMKPQGDTLIDISGNGNDLTAEGTFGQQDGGLKLYRTIDGNFSIPTMFFNPSNDFTIQWTGKLENPANGFKICDLGRGSGYGLELITYTGKFRFRYVSTVNQDLYSNDNYSVGVYYTIQCIRENDVIKMYINGVEQTQTMTGVGTVGYSNDFFIGNIGVHLDFKGWNRALSSQEIKDYHNNFAKQITFFEDFRNEDASGNNITPKDWIKGTGSYKISELTEDDSVLTHLKKGAKMLECTSAGSIIFQNTQSYGMYRWIFNKSNTANEISFNIITDSTNVNDSSWNGYKIHITDLERVVIRRMDTGSVTLISYTDVDYIQNNVNYELMIQRTSEGKFICYIRGGDFGNKFNIVEMTNDTLNPVIDNNHTTSIFTSIDKDVGDKIGIIQYKKGFEEQNNLLVDLAGYWKFDESSGAQAIDSFNSFDSISNNTTSTTGIINTGFAFNGSNQYVSLGDVLGYEYNNAFSFSGWVYRGTNSNWESIFNKMLTSGTYRGYQLGFRPNSASPSPNTLHFTLRYDHPTFNYIIIYGSTQVSVGSWHHVAVTYDGSNSGYGVRLYLNGSKETAIVYKDDLSGTILNDFPLTFGMKSDGINWPLTGSMDEIGMWNRVLTSGEILTLYNNNVGFPFQNFK